MNRPELRVALNGYVFFSVFGSEEPGLAGLFTSRRKVLRLVLTDTLIEQYREIGEGLKLPPAEIQTRLDRAMAGCNLVRRAGQEPGSIRGVPAHHRRILLQAIAAGATHLVTNWQQWLALTNHLSQQYGLAVITPEVFISQVSP